MGNKVLHVLHHSLPFPIDGYAIRAHAILKAQQDAGWNVCALTGSHTPEYEGKESVIDGVRYLRTPGKARIDRFGFRQIDQYTALVTRLAAVMQAERPDLVHVHSPVYNGLALLRVPRRLRVPAIYEVRATWEDAAVDRRRLVAGSLLYRGARALETYVFRNVDAVVTICDGLKQEVLRRGIDPEKVFVAPNGVRVDDFQPQPRNEELARALGLADGVVLGFIGSLFSYEGVEDLLDVAPEILQRCPNARFLIIGSGEKQVEVMRQIENLAGNGRVIYRPRVSHTEVRAHYSLVDCMVYPRRSVRLTELVTPLKPLEAMAMEKPVVASDIGGHRELITHDRTGLLYQCGSRAALADALCRIVSDAELRSRLAFAGKQYILQHRSWSQIVSGHFSAYEKALTSFSLRVPPSTRHAVSNASGN